VAEGARLESVFTGNRNVGSNPTPSAKLRSRMFADGREPQLNLMFLAPDSLPVRRCPPEPIADLWVGLWVGVRIPNDRLWQSSVRVEGCLRT
jgi:hypothetical protein